MDKLDVQIANDVRRVAGTAQGKRFPVMSGKVVSVEDDGTCTVQLTADAADTPTAGILLNVVSNNVMGISLTPAVNAHCIVGEVDGPGQLKELLWASSYDEIQLTVGNSSVTVKDGLIQLNDGGLGGLTKTLELQTQINKLNTLVSHLVTIISGAPIDEPGSGAPSALQAALKAAILTDSVGDFSAIENMNIKQG